MFLNENDLRKLQLQKLKILIQHAYQKVPYYKKLLDDAGIKPGDINSLDDLLKVPITNKKSIQSLPTNQILSSGTRVSRTVNLRTSGSAGEPLDIFIDKNDELMRRISLARIYLRNKRTIRDKVLVIVTPRLFLRQRWFHPVLYRLNLFQERHISIYENKDKILKIIHEYRPNIIFGYASIIKELVLELEKQNVEVTGVKTIFSTGEFLSAADRSLIKRVLKAEVFDCYAANECGIIAWECEERKGYHIDADNVLLEFLKRDGAIAKAGAEGEVVITNLNALTMPFIRYKLGDMGIFSQEECSCGVTLPLMKMVTGRVNDYLILPGGRKISPYLLMTTVDKIPEITRYQIIQKSQNRITIHILKNPMISAETVVRTTARFRELLGDGVEIDSVVVNGMREEKALKSKVIISKSESN